MTDAWGSVDAVFGEIWTVHRITVENVAPVGARQTFRAEVEVWAGGETADLTLEGYGDRPSQALRAAARQAIDIEKATASMIATLTGETT